MNCLILLLLLCCCGDNGGCCGHMERRERNNDCDRREIDFFPSLGAVWTMIAAVDQSAVNQGWIPAPLFLFQVREPAAVKVHRVMTDGI